ncbi:MAG TPA: tetratricopeptide repeat protein [Candidatus Baltobacteraceae bacterium]|nr:tetratricopeptide repeat protein [Candidatus Baltobacteraceae bacterium]
MIAPLLLAALAAGPFVHHPVTTANSQAQAAFDRGLTLLYTYNGDAAYDAFAQALRSDPKLAMAAWGQAMAAGPDLNTALDADRFARAQEAAQHAVALEPYASAEERSYVDAVARRYAGTFDDRAADGANYVAAMAALANANPADDDAAMLFAEALMESSGTDRMWEHDGTLPAAQTQTVLSLISRVLAHDPNQMMANHLCMHAYDYARDRAFALACADRVASWSFDAQEEHLAHMPAHTYIEAGLYAKALSVSETAWRLREQGAPEKYAAHDAYTGWSAAMMLGDLQVAEAWAIRTGEAYNGSDLWATWARFGQWPRIANSDGKGEFYAPFARGLTDVHFGVMKDAHAMLALYASNDADYRWILESAVDEREGRIPQAIDALGRALSYQQHQFGGEMLPLFPAGELLGALYYRQGRYSEAKSAFAQTLQTYPNDPRALYGLGLAQQRLGDTASRSTLKSFEQVWTDPVPPDLAQL